LVQVILASSWFVSVQVGTKRHLVVGGELEGRADDPPAYRPASGSRIDARLGGIGAGMRASKSIHTRASARQS
jgi:hypothetical protein